VTAHDPRGEVLVQRLLVAEEDEERVRAWVDELVTGDPDLGEAAVEWASTGSMPDAPEIEGFTPASLGHGRSPTEVFSLLRFLRRDPVAAKRGIRRAPDVGHPRRS